MRVGRCRNVTSWALRDIAMTISSKQAGRPLIMSPISTKLMLSSPFSNIYSKFQDKTMEGLGLGGMFYHCFVFHRNICTLSLSSLAGKRKSA